MASYHGSALWPLYLFQFTVFVILFVVIFTVPLRYKLGMYLLDFDLLSIFFRSFFDLLSIFFRSCFNLKNSSQTLSTPGPLKPNQTADAQTELTTGLPDAAVNQTQMNQTEAIDPRLNHTAEKSKLLTILNATILNGTTEALLSRQKRFFSTQQQQLDYVQQLVLIQEANRQNAERTHRVRETAEAALSRKKRYFNQPQQFNYMQQLILLQAANHENQRKNRAQADAATNRTQATTASDAATTGPSSTREEAN